jgi:hypothetical protein
LCADRFEFVIRGNQLKGICRHEGKVAAQGTVKSAVAELPMSALPRK